MLYKPNLNNSSSNKRPINNNHYQNQPLNYRRIINLR